MKSAGVVPARALLLSLLLAPLPLPFLLSLLLDSPHLLAPLHLLLLLLHDLPLLLALLPLLISLLLDSRFAARFAAFNYTAK